MCAIWVWMSRDVIARVNKRKSRRTPHIAPLQLEYHSRSNTLVWSTPISPSAWAAPDVSPHVHLAPSPSYVRPLRRRTPTFVPARSVPLVADIQMGAHARRSVCKWATKRSRIFSPTFVALVRGPLIVSGRAQCGLLLREREKARDWTVCVQMGATYLNAMRIGLQLCISSTQVSNLMDLIISYSILRIIDSYYSIDR